MKKLLALVLALVMSLGLATVGANAATNDQYSDKADINYEEAVAVLSEIGVLEGNEKGQFLPKEQLDRASAAKIIAYLALGNKTAAALEGNSSRFSDVPASHWASGYIEYLATAGVVAGDGTGKFLPSAPLTANAFAKMLLGVLGYKAEIEGLVGNDWQINTAKLANDIGLFDGNKGAVGSAVATRDEAALYAFNMLRKPVVEYDSTIHVNTTGGDKITVGNNKASEKTTSLANADKQTISNETGKDGRYIVEFAEQAYPDLELVGRNAIEHDAMGRPVRHWLNNNKDLGEFVRKDAFVASWTKNVTAKDLFDLLGSTYYDALKSGKTVLAAWLDGQKIDVIANNASQAGRNTTAENYLSRNSSYTINSSGNGTVTEVYSDENRNLVLVSYNTWVFQAAGDYNAASESIILKAAGDTDDYDNAMGGKGIMLENNFRVEADDFPEIKDLKNNDYVLVTAGYDAAIGRYVVKSIDKATILSGKVDSYSYASTYNVTIDGTKYSYSKTALAGEGKTKTTQYTVGEEAVVVIDKYGYIIAVDEAVVANNYVFISAFGASNTTLSSDALASATFTDGTTETIKVKSVVNYSPDNTIAGVKHGQQVTSKAVINKWNDKTPGPGAEQQMNHWYTWSKDSSGQYTLYGVGTTYTQGGVSYNQTAGSPKVTLANTVSFLSAASNGGTSTVTGTLSNTGVYANDNTIMVVNDSKEKVTVYEGVKNLPEIVITGGTAHVYATYKTASKYANVVYVDLSNATGSIRGAANDKLIYVIKYAAASRGADNEVYYSYVTLDGASEVTREADAQIQAQTGNTYHVANYLSENSKKQLTDFDLLKQNLYSAGNSIVSDDNVKSAASPIDWSSGSLTVGGTGYTLASDAQITLVVLGNVTIGNTKYDASALNVNKAKAYEATANLSGSQLANRLANYSYTYDYAIRKTSAGSNEIKELYVTVKTATATAGAGAGGGTTGSVGAATYATNARYDGSLDGDIVVRYNGAAAPTPTEIKSQVASLTGYSVSTLKRNNAGSYYATLSNGDGYVVDTLRVYTIKIDGTIVATYDGNERIDGATVPAKKDQAYILSGYNNVTDADATYITSLATANNWVKGDANGNLTMKAGGGTTLPSKDYELVSAFKVTSGSNITYTADSDTSAYASTGASGKLFAVNTPVRISVATPDAYVEFTDGGNVLQSASATGYKSDSDATYEFTVDKDVNVTAISKYLVTIDGESMGYLANGVETASFTAAYNAQKYLNMSLAEKNAATGAGAVKTGAQAIIDKGYIPAADVATYITPQDTSIHYASPSATAVYTVAAANAYLGNIKLVGVVGLTLEDSVGTAISNTTQTWKYNDVAVATNGYVVYVSGAKLTAEIKLATGSTVQGVYNNTAAKVAATIASGLTIGDTVASVGVAKTVSDGTAESGVMTFTNNGTYTSGTITFDFGTLSNAANVSVGLTGTAAS